MTIQDFPHFVTLADLWGGFIEQLRVRSDYHATKGDTASDLRIESLPTWYDGVTFRSRLEADWAATLDSLGIVWEYEPETLTLPSGTVYIPDFWLPELGTWLEVKGDGVPRIEKAIELGAARACHCTGACTCRWPGGELVLVGHPAQRCSDRTHGAYRRGGHPIWSSAHGRPTWLIRCNSCRRAGWIARVAPLLCRACRALPTGGTAYSSGDTELRFGDSDATPVNLSTPPAIHQGDDS